MPGVDAFQAILIPNAISATSCHRDKIGHQAYSETVSYEGGSQPIKGMNIRTYRASCLGTIRPKQVHPDYSGTADYSLCLSFFCFPEFFCSAASAVFPFAPRCCLLLTAVCRRQPVAHTPDSAVGSYLSPDCRKISPAAAFVHKFQVSTTFFPQNLWVIL